MNRLNRRQLSEGKLEVNTFKKKSIKIELLNKNKKVAYISEGRPKEKEKI